VGASLYLLGKDNHSHRSEGSDTTVTVALHPNPTLPLTSPLALALALALALVITLTLALACPYHHPTRTPRQAEPEALSMHSGTAWTDSDAVASHDGGDDAPRAG
jgi:hypothetical protein